MRRAVLSVSIALALVVSLTVPVGASTSPGTLVGFQPLTIDLYEGMAVPTVELDLVDSVPDLQVRVQYWNETVGLGAFHMEVPNGGEWEGGTGTFAFVAEQLITWSFGVVDPVTVPIESVCLFDWRTLAETCYSGDQIRAMGTEEPEPEEPEEPADTTSPTVWFEGYRDSYGLTDEVAITCAADDDSGIVSLVVCDGISGAALDLMGQTLTATATAVDGAGNETTLSRDFTIVVAVDLEGLVQLTRERVTKPGVAKALVAKLRTGAFDGYVHHLRAQSGKSVSADDAALLTRLVRNLG